MVYYLMESLKYITTHSIVQNLLFHMTYHQDLLSSLPSPLKDKILQITLAPGYQYPRDKIKIENILEILQNDKTEILNLATIEYNNEKILESLCRFNNIKEIIFPDIKYNENCLDLNRFVKALPRNLKSLTITNEPNVTDSVIKSIAENCKKLKLLNLKGCEEIGQTGFKHLTNIELCCLDLSKTKLNDESLLKLLEGKCRKTLKELKINNCHITHKGMQVIAKSCTLDYLSFNNIADNTNLQDLEFRHPLKDISWNLFF